MWNAIAYVTGGFSLVAFIIAVGYWTYRRRLIAIERLVSSATEASRPRVIENFLSTVHVDTTGLTRDQRYQLALKLLAQRERESRQKANLIALVALVLGVIAALALWRQTPSSEQEDPGVRTVTEVTPGPAQEVPGVGIATEVTPPSTPTPTQSQTPTEPPPPTQTAPTRTVEQALLEVFDFSNYTFNWRGASRVDDCRDKWEWQIELGRRDIARNATRLNYTFTCHRRNYCYNCGGDWDCTSPWPLHDWHGKVTADLTVEGDTVSVSNIDSPDKKFDGQCEQELIDLVKSRDGARVSL